MYHICTPSKHIRLTCTLHLSSSSLLFSSLQHDNEQSSTSLTYGVYTNTITCKTVGTFILPTSIPTWTHSKHHVHLKPRCAHVLHIFTLERETSRLAQLVVLHILAVFNLSGFCKIVPRPFLTVSGVMPTRRAICLLHLTTYSSLRSIASSEPPIPVTGPHLDRAVHGMQLSLCSTQLTGMLLVDDAQRGGKTRHDLIFHVSQLPGSCQVLLQLAGSRHFAVVEGHGEGGHGC